MGADLVTAWFWAEKDSFDIEAAKRAVRTATPEQLANYWLASTGETLEVYAESLKAGGTGKDASAEIQAAADAEIDLIAGLPTARGGLLIEAPNGDVLWLAGGTTWGDSPCEEFNAIIDLAELPGVMAVLQGTANV
jgi:hypothetical protein